MNSRRAVKPAAVFEWPDWSGETAVIIATGPSAKDVNLTAGQGRAKFLAITESWRLAPWADVLYGCDRDWWSNNRGVPEFKGLRVTASPAIAKVYGCHLVSLFAKAFVVTGGPVGRIGCGSKSGNGHSGFHAINLAVQFGAKRLILVGFDMSINAGWHWHNKGARESQPTDQALRERAKELDGCARQLDRLGVDVINTSMRSALQNYPKKTFEEAL